MMHIGEVFDEIHSDYTDKMLRWVPHYEDLLSLYEKRPALTGPHPAILDLGAGNGNATARILKRYPQAQIQLLDASEDMLHVAKSRFRRFEGLTFTQGMMQDLQPRPDSTDLVIACFSLHHLQAVDKQQVFQKVRELLREDGCFSYADLFVDRTSPEHEGFIEHWKAYVLDHGTTEDWQYLHDHYFRYDHPNSIDDQVKWLDEAGFSQIEISVFDRYWVHLLASGDKNPSPESRGSDGR